MSETQAVAGAGIPNFGVGVGAASKGEHTTLVSFGDPPRSVEFRKLDLADQWDIAELAGADPSPR